MGSPDRLTAFKHRGRCIEPGYYVVQSKSRRLQPIRPAREETHHLYDRRGLIADSLKPAPKSVNVKRDDA